LLAGRFDLRSEGRNKTMFAVNYEVRPSTLAGAGMGVFLSEPVTAGKILIFPNDRSTIISDAERRALPPDSIEARSSIRWFEDTYTVDPEWSDEAYLNHSFAPNAVWILGFVFALQPIASGEEVLIDYSVLLAEGEDCGFVDSVTGRPIVAAPYAETMRRAGEILLRLFTPPNADTAST
jgi:hypothetical protein